MKVLIACEFSGTIRAKARALGIDAVSCDLTPSIDNSPYHHVGDVTSMLSEGFDLMIAHPPCTYLANSGARWLHSVPGRWIAMEEACHFFNTLLNAPIPRICVENPIPHGHATLRIGKYTQRVQPWMFGHAESKSTCLWLKGLPLLQPTDDVYQEFKNRDARDAYRIHRMPPSPDRQRMRSITYVGIADAMIQQWMLGA